MKYQGVNQLLINKTARQIVKKYSPYFDEKFKHNNNLNTEICDILNSHINRIYKKGVANINSYTISFDIMDAIVPTYFDEEICPHSFYILNFVKLLMKNIFLI